MCGIIGIIKKDNISTCDLAFVAKATRLMAHRGPDGEGLWNDNFAALGHRRLAVIDLEKGKQPMSDSSSRFVVVFNGEIYNYSNLRRELEKSGIKFNTNSDTEVLLYAYIKWGESCLNRLSGIFAFAIWDTLQKKLFIARDHIGVKPLLYSASNSFCAFSSELKSFFLLNNISHDIDPTSVSDFLSLGYILTPKTILKDVKKLHPASFLIWQDGKWSEHQYWDITYKNTQNISKQDMHHYIEELRTKIDKAVLEQLVSDVPIGSFLSGGIDSTTITERMVHFYPQKVKTFSIGFKEESYNELPFAKLAANYLHTEHYEQIVTADFAYDLPLLGWFYDEPFAVSYTHLTLPTIYSV